MLSNQQTNIVHVGGWGVSTEWQSDPQWFVNIKVEVCDVSCQLHFIRTVQLPENKQTQTKSVNTYCMCVFSVTEQCSLCLRNQQVCLRVQSTGVYTFCHKWLSLCQTFFIFPLDITPFISWALSAAGPLQDVTERNGSWILNGKNWISSDVERKKEKD